MNLRKLVYSTVVGLGVTALCACGGSDSSEPIIPPVTGGSALQNLLDSTVGQDVPGLILSVQGEDIDFIGSAGIADLEEHTAMQTYYQMPAGSAGKKATALLVAMLHHEGLLNIEDKIANYLPNSILDNIPYSQEITIRQLLNHSAGVHDYLDEDTSPAWFEDGQNSIGTLKSDIDALEYIYNKPAYFAPGESVHYSNSHYLLAGLILDSVLGEHHHTALRNRVFIPLGMNNTYYSGFENDLGESIPGYILLDGEMVNTKPFYASLGVADAPLVTTVSDLSTLLSAIVQEDSVVPEEVQELLIGEDSIIETPYSMDFGLGVFSEIVEGHHVYHHGGDEAGYKTMNLHIVDSNTTITLFANCNGYEACVVKVDNLMQNVLAEAMQ